MAGPILRDGMPDWVAIEFDVLCSRCGYNLRTLTRPLCPECGLEFDWGVVLDRAADRFAWQTDFLFEHNWRRRPIRSWFTTVWRSFRPKSFWSLVSIHDPIATGPLWFIMAMSIVVFLVVLHGTAWLGSLLCDALAVLFYGSRPRFMPFRMPSALDTISSGLSGLAGLPFRNYTEYWVLLGMGLLVLAATLILLCSLRQTLGRCRVRTAHVIRLVGYTATPVLLATSLWIVGATCFHSLTIDAYMETTWYACVTFSYVLVPPMLLVVYLGIGLKRYLRLPRAWLLAIVTVFVAVLFTVTAGVVYGVLAGGGYG